MKTLLSLSICLILAASLCSCSVKAPPAPAITYYAIDYRPPVFENKPALPVALSIENFKTVPPYNTPRIVYNRDDYSRSNYYYHQWVSLPEEMITPLLARDFLASNYFKAAVLSGDISINHQLFGSIDKIYEQDADDQWHAVLSITVTLIDRAEKTAEKQFNFQKNYQRSIPLDQKNPKGLARAMSQALSEISSVMIPDIYSALKDTITN